MCQQSKDPSKLKIKIGNPAKRGATHTSLSNARQYEESGAGYFFLGQFWFVRGDEAERKLRRLYNTVHRHLQPNEPTPGGRPVIQPSPEWLRRMGYSRKPIGAR